MKVDALRTFIAIVDEGSFEGGAYALGITASAVSQRIKALESTLGQVVVRRTLPCEPTAAGEVLLAMARQVVLLQDETLARLGRESVGGTLRLAVNADSLATWLRPLLADAADWDDVTVHLEVEDQAHAVERLRRGDVAGAITSQSRALTGCRVTPLGIMRYLPVAAPGLIARHGGADDPCWQTLPTLRYNAKDDLQLDFLRREGFPLPTVQPQVPGSEAFAAAVNAGLGWGLLPLAQLDDGLERGRLLRLPGQPVDVPLFWHAWKIESSRIARVEESVLRAAASLLPLD